MEKGIRVLFLWELRGVVVQLPIEDKPKKKLNIKVVSANAHDAYMAAKWEARQNGKIVKPGIFSVIDVAVVYVPAKYPKTPGEYSDHYKQKAYDFFLSDNHVIDAVNHPDHEFADLLEEFQKLIQ